MMLPFLACLLCMMMGFLLGWSVMRESFYEPLRKRLLDALKGWEESIDLTTKLLAEKVERETKTTKKKCPPNKNTIA